MLKYLLYTYQSLRANAEQCKVLQQLTTYSSTPHLTRTHTVQLLYPLISIILLIRSTGQGRLFQGHTHHEQLERNESFTSLLTHTLTQGVQSVSATPHTQSHRHWHRWYFYNSNIGQYSKQRTLTEARTRLFSRRFSQLHTRRDTAVQTHRDCPLTSFFFLSLLLLLILLTITHATSNTLALTHCCSGENLPVVPMSASCANTPPRKAHRGAKRPGQVRVRHCSKPVFTASTYQNTSFTFSNYLS